MFDYSVIADWKWDNEILGLVAEIHEYKGKQGVYLYSKTKAVRHLKDHACEESASVLFKDEKSRRAYMKTAAYVNEKYASVRISAEGISELYGNTDLSAKKTALLDQLCKNYVRARNSQITDDLILIPLFILDYLDISPFGADSVNYCMALINLLLHQSGYFIGEYISLEKLAEEEADDFRAVFNQAVNGRKAEKNSGMSTIRLFLHIVSDAYLKLEEMTGINGEKKSAYDIVTRAVEKQSGDFTKIEILRLCPTLRSSSVEAKLKKLVEDGNLQRIGKGKATKYRRVRKQEKRALEYRP